MISDVKKDFLFLCLICFLCSSTVGEGRKIRVERVRRDVSGCLTGEGECTQTGNDGEELANEMGLMSSFFYLYRLMFAGSYPMFPRIPCGRTVLGRVHV